MATRSQRRPRNKTIVHMSHFIADESLDIKGTLCVGGNLEVHGDLKADRVFCFGAILVHGSIEVNELVSALGIDCHGSIFTHRLEVGCDGSLFGGLRDWDSVAEEMGQEIFPNVEFPLERLVDSDTMAELNDVVRLAGTFDHEFAVICGDDLTCLGIEIPRGIKVGGFFNPDNAYIHGHVVVDRMYCEGGLSLTGCLDATGNVDVEGALFAGYGIYCNGTLTTWGDVEAVEFVVRGDIESHGCIDVDEGLESRGKILSEGAITAGKYIKAGGVIASKVSVQAGRDHGVFAGLDVPRSEWPDRGYICAPVKPRNVLSGVYVTRKQKRPWKK